MSYQPEPISNDPVWIELRQGSIDYWLTRTGQKNPPCASYRLVNGKRRLGRYMDPYVCQVLMYSAKQRWVRWYTSLLIGLGAGALLGEVDWFFVFVLVPIFATWYLLKKSMLRRPYDKYYFIQQEILRTGQPQWVPYERAHLKLLKEPVGI